MHKFKIVYINACSIRNKLDEIEVILNTRQKPEILVITEIWLYENETEYYNISGYNSEFCSREIRGGGVAVYLREDINYNLIMNKNLNKCSYLHVDILSAKINLIALYRPPDVKYELFSNDLENIIRELNNKAVIIGDMNVDLLKDKQEKLEYELLLTSYGFRIVNTTRPTRITPHTKTLIDHVAINQQSMGVEVDLSPSPISDHEIQEVQMQHLNSRKYVKAKKLIKYVNYENYKIKLTQELTTRTINSFKELIDLVQKIKAESTQNRSINVSKEWINVELIQLMKQRDRLYDKMKKNPGNHNILQQFKEMKNKCNILRNKLKKRFVRAEFEIANGDERKTWNVINQLMKNDFSRKKPRKLEYLTIENKKITGDVDMANELNNYFINIGYNIGKEVQEEKEQTKMIFGEQLEEKTIYLKPCSQEELKSVIQRLKNQTASGIDGITTKDVKNSLEQLLPVLTNLINGILETGIYPDELKESIVTQVHKKGDMHDPGNKRPLSVITVFSKILEKIIKTRIVDFVDGTFRFDKHQFGFQEKSSTQIATTEMMEYITDNLDRQNYVLATYIDLQKAFDTVDREILLHKLQLMGIRGVAYSLISTYLKNRTQSTVVNGIRSTVEETKSGVPQGSVMGPILYLLYVHSLSLLDMEVKYITFADDVVLLYAHKEPKTLETIVNNDLKIYYGWLLQNHLKINASKTLYMVFSLKGKQDINIDIKIGNKAINRTDKYDYLGIIIDNQLNFSEHTNRIRKKLASLSGVLHRCAACLTRKKQKMIYGAMIETHIRYMMPIWTAARKTDIQRVQVAQNRALKRLYGFHWSYSTSTLYKELKLLKIENLNKLEEIKLIHKIANRQIKTNITLQMVSDVHNYPTRRRRDLAIPWSRTNLKKNSVTIRSMEAYNQIPQNIKSLPTMRSFTRRAKEYLMIGQNTDWQE